MRLEELLTNEGEDLWEGQSLQWPSTGGVVLAKIMILGIYL